MDDIRHSHLPPTYTEGFHDLGDVLKTQYRRLGNTDMIVSKLSLGGGPFGEIFGECDPVTPIVLKALKSGVNYIDTAYWYGQGKSEERIGEALKNIPRSAYYIGTKVGRYEKNPNEMFDFSAEKVFKSVEDSLRRLKLPYVDIIQIHDLEFAPSEETILRETLPALEKLKNAGKARYTGITGYPLDSLMSIIEKSTVQIDTILTYCRATLTDSSLAIYIPELEKRGIGIINAAPTAMGLLSHQGPPTWHPANFEIVSACACARQYCKDNGVSLSKLASNYSVNFPGVSTTLSGANKMEHLLENLEASWSDLTTAEEQCKDYIEEMYFKKLNNMNWEGVEVAKYRTKLNQKDALSIKK